MYDELVKRLRELQTITKHCGEQSCDECENRELCDKHDNKTLSGTYKEAADAIEELSRENESLAKSVNEASEILRKRWIPVTERLPDDGVPVQACYIGFISGEAASDLLVCRYEGMWCYWDGEPCSYDPCRVEITHWMPLPEPPKEE